MHSNGPGRRQATNNRVICGGISGGGGGGDGGKSQHNEMPKGDDRPTSASNGRAVDYSYTDAVVSRLTPVLFSTSAGLHFRMIERQHYQRPHHHHGHHHHGHHHHQLSASNGRPSSQQFNGGNLTAASAATVATTTTATTTIMPTNEQQQSDYRIVFCDLERWMSLRIMILVWRRKGLIFAGTCLILTGLWCWALFLSAPDSSRAESTHTHKKVSVKDNETGDGKPDGLLQRLGFSNFMKTFHSGEHGVQAVGVKFVKPTGVSTQNVVSPKREIQIMGADAERVLQHLEVPSRDEIGRRRQAAELADAGERQTRYEHELQRMSVPVIAGLGPDGYPPPKQRIVHLDMKGAPPKISYLKRLLPILKNLGATGVLLEYEDMFPFAGTLEHISAENKYSVDELRDLLNAAAVLDLNVIPLVQTFGHLEFALKLPEFRHLREVDESPQSICPSLNESHTFVHEIIRQVVQLHRVRVDERRLPALTHIHIGCDEVLRLGECARCKSRTHTDLFLSHVTSIAGHIHRRWPDLRIIVWDDMLRHLKLVDLQDSQIGELVEPMVWVYAEDIYGFVSTQTWDKYATAFPTVWMASAFKGAHGETLLVPPVRRHLDNTLRWLAVIQSQTAAFRNGVQGLALTGWQRYDHFATLCELLPVTMPSLAVCLATASLGRFPVDAHRNPILSSLSCPEVPKDTLGGRPWIEFNRDAAVATFSRCMFPGNIVFRYVFRLAATLNEVREFIDSLQYKRGWLTDYNIRNNFSSPARVEDLIEDVPRLLGTLTTAVRNAWDFMSEMYDDATIVEFIEQRIDPLAIRLRALQTEALVLANQRVWPRRPLSHARVSPSDGDNKMRIDHTKK